MAFEFARLLRSALVRRLAYVLVAAVLAWCGIGRAQAADTSGQCPVTAPCPRPVARDKCEELIQFQISIGYYADPSRHRCRLGNTGISYVHEIYDAGWQPGFGGDVFYFVDCAVDEPWNEETHTCKKPKDCATEPDLGAGTYVASDPDICIGGCMFAGKGGLCVGVTVDSAQNWFCSAWEATGAECAAGQSDTPTAPTDSDGDGSSDGNDTAPNNPGQGGGGNDGKPQEDGGGKGDGNGSGEGSGNGNTSGGGGDCASPPSSSGDAILAQIAYQTWATRCSIEGAKDGNGNLKTTQGGSGTGSDGGDGSGDGTDFGTSNPGEDEAFDPADVKRFGIPVNTSMLDSEAIFGGGTCPVLSVTIYGKTFSTNEIQGWCDLLRILRSLVLIFAAFTALRILMGNNT